MGETTNSIKLGLAVFLLPATILYLLGVLFGLVAMATTPLQEGPSALLGVLGIAAILVVAGCGIGALWWLVANYEKLSLPDIPVRIWVGLGIGVLISVASILGYYTDTVNTPRQGYVSFNETWLWIVFGGPVFVLLTLLSCIALKK
ncbi:MAG: hypothetical protein ACREX4_14645 [Gammaproteobacteria bacterium]